VHDPEHLLAYFFESCPWGLSANRHQSRATVEKAQGGLGEATLISAQSPTAPDDEGRADFEISLATLAKGSVLLYEW